jgi:rhodanese-related sulfurtransferase
MNDSPEPVAVVPRDSGDLAWRQVITILAAAVALGLVYNIASPLGVRAPKPESQAAMPLTKSNLPATPLIPPAFTNPTSVATSSASLSTNVSPFIVRWAEVKALLEAGQIVLVDGRPKTAYDIEHIPGAVSLPGDSPPAEFIAFATKYPQDTAVVVYCSSENCDAAHELAEKLRKELGFKNVKEMPGGVVEYRVTGSKTNPPSLK